MKIWRLPGPTFDDILMVQAAELTHEKLQNHPFSAPNPLDPIYGLPRLVFVLRPSNLEKEATPDLSGSPEGTSRAVTTLSQPLFTGGLRPTREENLV